MNRTPEEILSRIESIKSDDVFGFQTVDLISYLDFKDAKQFLKDDVSESDWEKTTITPKEAMIDYMEFAWRKANDGRGLSASRSLDHYTSWLWLDGDENLHRTLRNYNCYGKDKLVEICKYLGLDSNIWDDGIRMN